MYAIYRNNTERVNGGKYRPAGTYCTVFRGGIIAYMILICISVSIVSVNVQYITIHYRWRVILYCTYQFSKTDTLLLIFLRVQFQILAEFSRACTTKFS